MSFAERAFVKIFLFVATLALLTMPAAAGRLHPPKHTFGVPIGQSFAGVLVYEDVMEFRIGDDWYRIQVPASSVERISTITFIVLALFAAVSVGYAFRRRRARRLTPTTPTENASTET
jgi:hypothetical protein